MLSVSHPVTGFHKQTGNHWVSLPLSLWLTALEVHPERTWADSLARVRYCLRGLCRPRLTAEWINFLNTPALQPIVRRHPYILSKPQRPYLHRRLRWGDRVAQLKAHYEFVTSHFSEQALMDIYTRKGFKIASLPWLDPGHFGLYLFYYPHSKEGELSLALVDQDTGGRLFRIAFSVTRPANQRPIELFIGGLQGCKPINKRELVVWLTRSLHGLRPKALLVFALQQLAQQWSISTIRAVGSKEHVYRCFGQRSNLLANYDEFWAECHGTLLPDGNFQIPVHPPTRDAQELPRGKRSVYRRRYEMLNWLAQEISSRIRPDKPFAFQRSNG